MRRTERQIVAAAFRGRLDKPVRDMTPAYVHRLAREVAKARAEGRRPERQAGRGHRPHEIGGVRVTTEHPKAFVRRHGSYLSPADARNAPIRVSAADRHVAGHGVIVQREFRSGHAAWRYLRTLGEDPAQAVAHGDPQPTYATMVSAAVMSNNPSERIWRVFYTGNGAGDQDENGATAAGYADWKAAAERIFVPGTIDRYIVRRQQA